MLPAAFGGGGFWRHRQAGLGRIAGTGNFGCGMEYAAVFGDGGFDGGCAGGDVCGGCATGGVGAQFGVLAVYGFACLHCRRYIAALSAMDGIAAFVGCHLCAAGVSVCGKDVLAAWDDLPEDYVSAARAVWGQMLSDDLYVTAPLLKPALRRGLTLAAATCIGEFAATLFLSRPEWQTLTTLIYSYLGRAGRTIMHGQWC